MDYEQEAQHPDNAPPSLTRSEYGALGAAALLVLAALIFSMTHTPPVGPPAAVTETGAEAEGAAHIETPFERLSLSAASAYVLDMKTGRVLYTHNPHVQLPLASLTKVMTAFVARNRLAPDAPVTITPEALAVEGESGLYLKERWRLRDLLDFTLMTSSNDGAAAAAAAAAADTGTFVAAMNEEAQNLGLRQTYFLNSSGLDVNRLQSGGYGSARDIAHLFAAVLTHAPDLVEATRHARLVFSSDRYTHVATNTNTALGALPGLIGAKTGFTDLADGNLVVAFDASLNHPVVAVVLSSTQEARFSDMLELVEATRATLALRSVSESPAARE